MNERPTMPPPSQRSRLLWLLNEEIREMEALARLLEKESHLLLSTRVAELEQLLEAKSLHVSELAALDSHREALFRELGIGGNREQSSHALATLFPADGLDDLWQRLTTLAEECRRLNRINGATMEMGQAHLSQALEILRGGASQTTLYNPEGEKTREHDGLLLGQA